MKVKLSCEHTEERNIPTDPAKQRMMMNYYRYKAVCRKCAALRAEQLRESATGAGFPVLVTGTPQQKIYAEEIRIRFYKGIIKAEEDSTDTAEALHYLKTVKNSHIWIAAKAKDWKGMLNNLKTIYSQYEE